MKTKALDRAGRKATIILWFAIRIQHDNLSYATSYDIARGLGLSASGKLRTMLKELVEDGSLTRIEAGSKEAKALAAKGLWKERQGRFKGSGYMLASGTYNRPRRTVNFNAKGKNLGQMEMAL